MSGKDPRQHSAEHLMTSVFGDLYKGRIIDTRFKGTKVRCDYEIPGEFLPEDVVSHVEYEVNRRIGLNLPVSYEITDIEKSEKICSLHRLPTDSRQVRLVYIGDKMITPCSGEHVGNTSEIGKVKIRTFQVPEPGILRLTFAVE